MAEEVERGALGGQQCRGGSDCERHLGRHLLAPLPLDHEVVDVLGPALAHRLGDRSEAEDDARLLLHDPRPSAGALRHRRLRGDVAVADVLGQRPRHDLAEVDHVRHPNRHGPSVTRRGAGARLIQ